MSQEEHIVQETVWSFDVTKRGSDINSIRRADKLENLFASIVRSFRRFGIRSSDKEERR